MFFKSTTPESLLQTSNVRVVGSDNEDPKRNPEMPSIPSEVSTSSFCGTISDDSICKEVVL